MAFNRVFIAVVVFLLVNKPLVVEAGEVLLSYDVAVRYSDDGLFSELALDWQPGEIIDDGPGLYQIDMYMQAVDRLPHERGFASMAFDTTLSGAISIGLEYQPDTTAVDCCFPFPGGVFQKWTTNLDAGIPGDWNGMLIATVTGVRPSWDWRMTLGDPDAEFFGSFFVRWGGMIPGTMTVHNFQFSFADLNGVFLAPQLGQDLSIQFGIPEPASGVLVWMALVFVLTLRPRKLGTVAFST